MGFLVLSLGAVLRLVVSMLLALAFAAAVAVFAVRAAPAGAPAAGSSVYGNIAPPSW